MSLHYLVKHEWPKNQQNSPCSKKPSRCIFLLSHFSAVDLAQQNIVVIITIYFYSWIQKLDWRASQCWNSDWSHHLTGEGRARSKQMTTINIFLHFVNFIVYPIILAIQRSSYSKQFFISEENEIYLFMHRLNRFFKHGEFHWFFGHSCFTR